MKATAIGFVLAGLAAVVATVLVIRATQPRVEEAWASAGWPTVDGTVIDVRATRRGAHVRYRYEVGGRTYESDRVRLVRKLWADSRSEIVERYDEGKRVVVSYDPDRPERAVLEPGTSWPAVIKKYVGGGIFGLLGLGLVGIGVRGLRP